MSELYDLKERNDGCQNFRSFSKYKPNYKIHTQVIYW